MAEPAPTQELPPWLSDSTSVATNAAGEPTATFTTVINLPLTYYGPSIPLGPASIWVYGGPTSPPPSSFNIPSTNPGSTITSSNFATPTPVPALPPMTSLSQSSTLTTLSGTTSSPPPSPFPSSVSSSVSSSSTSTPPINGKASGSNHAGVIVGSVLGSVVGSLLLLSALICFVRRRQRPRARRPEPPTGQVMWMWHDVGEDDHDLDIDDTQLRSPGDASPQSSGDEHESFLRRGGEASNGARDAAATARLVDAPRTSRDSSGPIGVALATGSKTSIPSPKKQHTSREQLAEKPSEEPSISPPSADRSPEVDIGPDSPLLPPPPINVSHGSRRSLLPSERSMTPGNDPESALFYTAQRVNVSPSSPGTPWTSGIGIPNILRRSWLSPRTRSATPTSSSPKSSLLGRQLTDSELEAGRSLNTQLRAEMGYREGVRPLSGLSAISTGSARSGNTVFYDAQSREDLSVTPPPLPQLPQGTASTGRNGPSPLSGEPLRASGESEEPPAYELNPPDNRRPDDAVDYLDVPIPRPASPFASVSSVTRLPPPPGLGAQASTSVAAPPSDIAIDIEMLEEPPPAAGESWRQIAQALPDPHERRTTFGLVPSTIVYPRETTVSEQGSLHSMRSHVSPLSAPSASGSAPVSNSNSAHSRGLTASSLRSLAHSSSISSADRRLLRPSPGEVSPPLSATGRHLSVPPPSQGVVKPLPVLPPAAPEPVQSATIRSTGTRSSVMTHASLTDPVTGEVVRVSHPSWTGGRNSLERPDVRPPPSSSWGGSWSSPSHLRILQNRVAGREDASHA